MLSTTPYQFASADPISTGIPLIPFLLVSTGTLSTVLYFRQRHRIRIDTSQLTYQRPAQSALVDSTSMPAVALLGVASTWSLSGPWL